MHHFEGNTDFASLIRTIPDHPKPGILFRDITTLVQDGAGFGRVIELLTNRYRGREIDRVAAIEARGLIFGAAVAASLGIGFVPVRKAGKLPHATIMETYTLEYGSDALEIHRDAIRPGERVLLIDDLIATGGTAGAAVRLVRRLGGVLEEFATVIELTGLPGRTRLVEEKVPVFALLAMRDN